MTSPSLTLVWGSPRWATAALLLAVVAAVALLWSYGRARAAGRVRATAAALKVLGLAALLLGLLEPLLAGSRPRPGANAFAVVADNSQSLLVRDAGSDRTRGDRVRDLLRDGLAWKARLGQDFDVRNYVFDSHLRAADGFEGLAFDGNGSALGTSLDALSKRFRGLPLAGVLLFTDGNRTDAGDVDFSRLPPVYPVMIPSRGVARDVGVTRVSASQTNFDAAPVVIRADVAAVGLRGETVVAAVTDETGQELARDEARPRGDGQPLSFRFQFRPPRAGVNFFRVLAFAPADEAAVKAGKEGAVAPSGEQTLANNGRLVVVDQGGGPYRVLYVGGRPAWEFKFLRRAAADDEQVQLVGLIRIAKRQPKFDFRDARDRSTSRLFQGFDHPDADTAERHDQPVLVRLGTRDETELRDGFPRTAADLYQYHAIVLDDVEAGFFTQDQLTLLRSFVSHRGGGLLMLGGPESFAQGKYDHTPVGELLPVYLNGPAPGPGQGDGEYRLVLTREGWLEPWVRTRRTEDDEGRRLAAMPPFRSLTRVGPVKPGAVVLSRVHDASGGTAPALVAQQFGQGHVAALLVGDLWRWGIRRQDPAEDDLDRSWRQTIRWLVGDVPGRVEVSVRPKPGAAASGTAVDLTVRVRDAEYRPLDDAKVVLAVTPPGGKALTLDAEPAGDEPGAYAASYAAKTPGAYRVVATATAPDGAALSRSSGWAAQPSADEFARLEPDVEFLKSIAAKTGGELVDAGRLDSFVASLASRPAPVVEPWTSPLWNHPAWFLFAIACLTAEWGIRRLNGLA